MWRKGSIYHKGPLFSALIVGFPKHRVNWHDSLWLHSTHHHAQAPCIHHRWRTAPSLWGKREESNAGRQPASRIAPTYRMTGDKHAYSECSFKVHHSFKLWCTCIHLGLFPLPGYNLVGLICILFTLVPLVYSIKHRTIYTLKYFNSIPFLLYILSLARQWRNEKSVTSLHLICTSSQHPPLPHLQCHQCSYEA